MAELPEQLRAAARAHRPDRARMLARVERAMAASGPRPAEGPRPADGLAHAGQDPGRAPGDAPPHLAPTPQPAAPQDAAAQDHGVRGPGDGVAVGPVRALWTADGERRAGTGAIRGPAAARASGPAPEGGGSHDGRGPYDDRTSYDGRGAYDGGGPHDELAVHEGPYGDARHDGDGRHDEAAGAGGAWEGAPAPWVRVAAVAAAVAGAIGLGGLAVGAASHGSEPKPPAVSPAHSAPATTPPPQGAGTSDLSAGESRAPDTPHTGASATTRPTGRPSGRPAGHTPVAPSGGPTTPAGSGIAGPSPTPQGGQQNGVSARAGVNPSSDTSWMEEDITLTTDRPLTSLTVELRVAMTPGVSSTGQYDSAPGLTSVSTTVEGDDLVYRWTLDQGQTLDPGTYTFAGQFNHDYGDRDTGGDSFSVSVSGPDGSAASDGSY